MPTLHACLAGTPRRTLLIMAQLHGLKPQASAPKAQLVHTLQQALLEADHIRYLLPRLTDRERAVLSDLLAADGHRMPLKNLAWRYGPIRPYKPWREDLPRQPWRDPASPAERPFYLGLLFLGTGPGTWGPQPYVLIPDDLAPLLSALAPPTPAEAARVATPAPQAGTLAPLYHACRDLAALLGLLHGQDVRPLHERWLPPRYLGAWNARCVLSEPLDDVRGELQTGRLRALHFLAEAAGLVGLSGPYLKPTPRGWEWLAQERPTQLQALWEAWTGDTALWGRFQMPGHPCPFILEVLTSLLPHLAQAATTPWLETERFVDAVQQASLALADEWERWVPAFRARALSGFLTGFLAALGVTEHEAGNKGRLRVTQVGAWLLGAGPEPAWPETEPLTLTLAPDGVGWLRVELPPHPNLVHLARLEAFGDWDAGRYMLTPASFNRARGRGATLEALVALLDKAQGAPLSPALRQALRAWERSGARMTLSRPALLECDDPTLLSQLTRKRRFRQRVTRTLSPRAVILDDAHLGATVRHLRREGHDPRLLLPLEEAEASSGPLDARRALLAGRGAAAFHLLAGRVYHGLARFIPLPAPYPADLLDELAQALPAAEVAAAEAGAERALEALAAALNGWAPHPSPEPGLDPEVLRPQIEAAIRDDKALRITYWTAGRGALTHREVAPYRLERRGRVLYLVAYCYQARGERVFRLDRMRELTLVDKPQATEAEEPTWYDWD